MATSIQDRQFPSSFRRVSAQLLQEVRDVVFFAFVTEFPEPIQISRPAASLALAASNQPVDSTEVKLAK